MIIQTLQLHKVALEMPCYQGAKAWTQHTCTLEYTRLGTTALLTVGWGERGGINCGYPDAYTWNLGSDEG